MALEDIKSLDAVLINRNININRIMNMKNKGRKIKIKNNDIFNNIIILPIIQNDVCVICFNDFNSSKNLIKMKCCNCYFHKNCLQFNNNNYRCYMCRKLLNISEIIKDLDIISFLDFNDKIFST